MPKGIFKNPKERIEKIRKALKGRVGGLEGRFKKGHNPFAFFGKLNGRWIGGKSNWNKSNWKRPPQNKAQPRVKQSFEQKRILHNFYEKRRKARKRGNGGSYTFDEWENLKAQYNWTCPCCKKAEPEIKLTVDHIIPLSRGGSNNIENIQPLCRGCNSKKRTKVIKYQIS